MKTSKITLSLAIVTVAGSLMFTSCRKKEKTEPQEPDNEQTSASDNAMAEGTSNDVIAMGSQVSENTGTLTTFKTTGGASEAFMFSAGCASITSAPGGTVAQTQYTVDFGAAGCTGQDGRVRKGKLYFDFSGSTNGAKYYRHPGFKMNITSSGYEIDGNTVSINKTVSNTTPTNVIGTTGYVSNLTWKVTSNISINKANNGGNVTWNCDRTQELTNTSFSLCYNGQNIPINWTKAIVKVNGSANGVNSKGENYTVTAKDLVRDFTCAPNGGQPHRHPFISGTIDYTPGTRATRHIDYGTGTCDFNATVEINGQTFTMTIP